MTWTNYSLRILSVAAIGVLSLGVSTNAHADLRITEVMSSSGGGGTNDWFEVTNFGASSIDITGFRMDDDSNSFGSSRELFGDGFTEIGAGETVVFLETATPATQLDAFREFWFGANVPSNFKIGSYSGSGVSFSSGGDGVVVFDSAGTVMAPLTLFGAATTGSSFDNYDGSLTSGLPASQVGVNGAFVSNNALGNIGSPGAIPEPSSVAVMAIVGLVGCGLRRKR